jgi:hypothetical protein
VQSGPAFSLCKGVIGRCCVISPQSDRSTMSLQGQHLNILHIQADLCLTGLRGCASQSLELAAFCGFNLMVGDLHCRQVAYVSNRDPQGPRLLGPGHYGELCAHCGGVHDRHVAAGLTRACPVVQQPLHEAVCWSSCSVLGQQWGCLRPAGSA